MAASSLDLLIYRNLPNYEPKFELIDFMVLVENKRRSSLGTGWREDNSEHPILSEATIKIKNVLMGLVLIAIAYVWLVIMFILDSEVSSF